jgi:hypothetical protein
MPQAEAVFLFRDRTDGFDFAPTVSPTETSIDDVKALLSASMQQELSALLRNSAERV